MALGQDKTVVYVGGVNTTADNKRVLSCLDPISNFSAILNIFETGQLQIGN